MEDVETPGTTTIDALGTFLGIPRSRRPPRRRSSSPAMGGFVVAIVRGDYDVNETKLANASRR